MAFGMQNPSSMKIVMVASLYMFSIFGMVAAHADEACVGAYRKANTEYFNNRLDLGKKKSYAKAGMGGAGVADVICTVANRSLVGAIGCAGGFGLIGGAAYLYHYSSDSQLSRLTDAHRLFQIYDDYTNGDAATSDEVKKFITSLKIDEGQTESALKEFSTLMKWGSMCDGENVRTYDDAVQILTARLQAPQAAESPKN